MLLAVGIATMALVPKRFICNQAILGPSPIGFLPDHIDGDRLNNQRVNLRRVTRGQNALNGGVPRNNSSGFRGVSWHKSSKTWQAYITVAGRRLYLGQFAGIKDAARAYDRAAVKHFGEFAV